MSQRVRCSLKRDHWPASTFPNYAYEMGDGRHSAKVSDTIINSIRDRILSERLPVGTSLTTEFELMERYGLGRVSVRESLRVLERDGLVSIKRGRGGGVSVGEPNVESVSEHIAVLFAYRDTPVRDFVEFRQLFEPRAAALAAENATAKQREEFAKQIKTQREIIYASTGMNHSHSIHTAVNFHDLVATSSGNGVIELISRSVRRSFDSHFRDETISFESAEETLHAHELIGESIISGDSDLAFAVMSDHVRSYAEIMTRHGMLDEPIIPSLRPE